MTKILMTYYFVHSLFVVFTFLLIVKNLFYKLRWHIQPALSTERGEYGARHRNGLSFPALTAGITRSAPLNPERGEREV